MAFPLSSSITLSFTPSTPKRHFLSTHFAFRFSQARSQENARPFQLKVQCKASKEAFVKDKSQCRNIPTSFNLSNLINGTMKLENVIAVILILAEITSPLPLAGWDFWSISPANAVLYSPETKLPRTGELALRRAIPANTNMKAIQDSLEDISYLLRIPQRKPYGTSLVVKIVQAPGLSFLLPEQYLKYPRLTGRAIVELTIEKGDGSSFSPEAGGELRKTATIQVVLDGYSAPLTTGNFAKLVTDGAYDGKKLSCINQAIISENDTGKNGYSVPLEIMPSGQFEPLYKTTLSVQDGELPVLPLSVYGAVAMAHSEVSEEYSSPYQFFFYLYDKRNSGLGGISFEEGQFSVFGYITAGREILPQIKTGDIIKSAKLVEGRDRLVLPSES
ncbi:hypothetical protein GOBAR_DD10060 [Gossypium barbadense]|nr:hypothetical protein GOBAR_DD10060 [Gossypium barbadense]